MKIAGKQTVDNWKSLKTLLESKPTPLLWERACQFHRARIDTRYLYPIASITKHDRRLGEGFAIVALFCTLVEYLESCERGDNFRWIGKKDKLAPHEYSQHDASQLFKDFLRERPPFNTLVPKGLIDSFYRDIRCGLLHEARTKGTWTLSTRKSGGRLVSPHGTQITLYRNELIPAIKTYLADYQRRLLIDPNTQAAFIRKFDYLCLP